MADISGKQICKLLTFLGAVTALILGIIILTKVNKKGWCGEGFDHQVPKSQGMVLKATNACAYISGQISDAYPCARWDLENKKNGICVSQDGSTTMPCRGSGTDYGPLDCCDVICPNNRNADGSCSDPNN